MAELGFQIKVVMSPLSVNAKSKLPSAFNSAKEIPLLSQSSIVKATETPQYDKHIHSLKSNINLNYFPWQR